MTATPRSERAPAPSTHATPETAVLSAAAHGEDLTVSANICGGATAEAAR